VAGVASGVAPTGSERLVATGEAGDRRLGLDEPPGWWPTTPRLKSYEAAGFRYVQVSLPRRELLADSELVKAHAGALRDRLNLTSMELILHAPHDLHAGSDEHDRQLDGALSYAVLAGAKMIVYHGAQIPIQSSGARNRLAEERRSLRQLVRRGARVDIQLAIENLAPAYPGLPECVCHDPAAVHELVRRLDSDHAGMCLDLGHAQIAAGLAGCELAELVEPVLDRVTLFHVHDNLGSDNVAPRSGGIEPCCLDLHLPPGAGKVPWATLAPMLASHPAPLQLEIHPNLRLVPATLAILAYEVLGLRRGVAAI
jgi:sugar phosphate isomerase/epimerase